MIIFGWLLLGFVCAAVMMLASRQAVRSGMAIANYFNVSSLLVGMTLFAIGTDVPEIVNSFVASYHGHGDVNVGDSIGSAFVQGTLVLGVFPLVLRKKFDVQAKVSVIPAVLTIFALALGMWLLSDGAFSRPDAALLLLLWPVAIYMCWRLRAHGDDTQHAAPRVLAPWRHIVLAFIALGIVALAAYFLLRAIVALSTLLAIPQYVLSFFGASIGTSLPELAVEITALRRGNVLLAMGDVLGSCLVDATLSVAAGPLLFPTAVSAELMQKGAMLAMTSMVFIICFIGVRRRHDKLSAGLLIALYLLGYFVL